MKRHTSSIDEMERELGPQRQRKRRRTPLLDGASGDDEELGLDEHFPWHRIRRLHRK